MTPDVIIIGGGVAGLSAACFLSEFAQVTLLEREPALATQSSARTAGQFTTGISGDTMRAMAAASRSFFQAPPPGFCEPALVAPRGCLTVGREEHRPVLDRLMARLQEAGADCRFVDRQDALALFPALRPERVYSGVFEADAMDIDVDLLLQSYRKAASANGARFLCTSEVTSIQRIAGTWQVTAGDLTVSAPVLVNAAGAWADRVADLAGVPGLGLKAFRRSAFTFPLHRSEAGAWPHVTTADYSWYVHPQPHGFTASPAEADAADPGDVYADDLRLAEAIHHIGIDTNLTVHRPSANWAGLRTFAPDRNPVCGGFADHPGYFVSAGQGGCGVLTSPAMGQALAAVVQGADLPGNLAASGITVEQLAPARLMFS
ncbi:FAD-binding oxidoreductase [Stappia sp. BW2]|uniref:NAD(P)/FAD-dependent oxidoreductase n=1 Tax=Stappia sp. BW2 TaxID=2592622 RepID=UPI0011DEF82E|nr:FAD-binding oxidoreductase [Stappia sp. BW2]TYC72317.1 FAD-binding oxidoreductase [Stappia sp. BW2]